MLGQLRMAGTGFSASQWPSAAAEQLCMQWRERRSNPFRAQTLAACLCIVIGLFIQLVLCLLRSEQKLAIKTFG